MPFWWKPYESLMEQKPIGSQEALMRLIADELCEICESFPPPLASMEWLSPQFEKRFASELESMPTIDQPMAGLLRDILIHELRFEAEATAALFRNQKHIAACPTPLHESAIHFLWPIMLEVLHIRKEECSARIGRKDLIGVVEIFFERFTRRSSRILH